MNEGFYADRTKALVQDSLGFLWLGTSDGLCRYDGSSFNTFDALVSQSKLIKANIICLFRDKQNNIWAGTDQGLLYYNHIEGRFKTIRLPIKSTHVKSITQDENGQIWAGTVNGIFVVDKNQHVTYLNHLDDLKASIVLTSSAIAKKVFLITYNYIFTIDNTSHQIVDSIRYSNDKIIIDNFPTATVIDSEKQLWIGKNNGELVRYNLLNHLQENYDLKKQTNNPSAEINNIFVNNDQRVWICVNEYGVIYFDHASQKFVDFETIQKNHLPTYKVSFLYIDRKNNYWFGMEKNGLALANNYINYFHRIEEKVFDKNKIISSVLKDHSGQLWVGSDGGGLYLFDPSNKLKQHFKYNSQIKGSLSNDAVLSLFEDSQHRIWVGTYKGGLSLYNPKEKNFKHYQKGSTETTGLLRNDVRKIAEDKNGFLWLAIHGKGVTRFDPRSETFIHYPILPSIWTNDLCITKDGSIWIASSSGLFRKKAGQENFTPITESKNSLPELHASCLYEDANNQMWIGTPHGLYMYDTRQSRFVLLNISDILSTSSIKSINQDASGKFFIATNVGLFRYDREKNIIDHFLSEAGLHSNDFIINACFKHNNTLYLGTSNGFCWFDVSSITTLKTSVPVYLTDIKVFNASIQFDSSYHVTSALCYQKGIELNYDQNYVSFSFAFPSYTTGSSKLNFEYKMDGLDKYWLSGSADKQVLYTSLPPGHYVLHVRLAKNNFYTLENGELLFTVIVHPPFYETWWFRTLFVLLITTCILFYYRYKTKKLKESNRLLEIKITERTTEIRLQNERLEAQRKELEIANTTKDTLFYIIAHDLRSPFTAIFYLSDSLSELLKDQYSSEVNALTNGISRASKNAYMILENLLQWARSQSGKIVVRPDWLFVNSVIQNLVDSVSFQTKEKQITLNSSIETLFEAHIDQSMFETIVRNLLANAVKFTPKTGRITISVLQNTSGFELSIQDSGVGMDNTLIDKILNQKVDSSEQGTIGERGTGLGLLIVRDFIQQLGARWEIASKKNLGTKITVYFTCSTRQYVMPESNPSVEIENNAGVIPNVLDAQMELFLKGKTILIVDDQEDIRNAIKMQLQHFVDVYDATNGADALLKAKEIMPDLILSDVVMPEMDGVQFCTKIKSDLLTSHIPVIMLTSQQEEQDVIDGLKSGVDDYILKPFNASILLLKITNLLLNRERMKKKFSLDNKALIDSFPDHSLDKKFLAKVSEYIELNIANEEFGVEMLSSEMGLHRTSLNKKITALTGFNTNEWIKNHRMKLAGQLLLTGDKNISEVAYAVGFADPKYFSKSFKTHFGILPSDYVLNNKK